MIFSNLIRSRSDLTYNKMKLHNLTPSKGSVKKRKRIARGAGAGTGGTATRGHKGAKSRSGYSSKRAHEGGQMPLQMRLPKRGFKNSHRRYKSTRPADYKAVSLTQLSEFATKHNLKEITPAALAEVGVISKAYKVLASGELSSALEVTANKFSKTAKKAITDAGGKAYVEVKLSTVQGVAKEAGVDTVDVALLAKHV